ncbi:MAG: TRAM domain-containing protein [Parachlamydiales bacterium]|nr:TRAM domain-containing protein [Parachlamydiales bacterium]
MNISLAFVRLFFLVLSVLFSSAYFITHSKYPFYDSSLIGIGIGLVIGFVLIGLDLAFRRHTLRSFNIAVLGLFFGYLMGFALNLIFDALLSFLRHSPEVHATHVIEIIKIFLYLFGTYLGVVMTLKSADELYVSIPFVKFSPTTLKKKDILIDLTILNDARIIDLAGSGIMDDHLIMPRIIIKELFAQAESSDENVRAKARISLDIIKKLEALPNLGIRYNDTDFPDIKDYPSKLVRLARLVDANILTADLSRVPFSNVEGVRLINLHSLANALKPITQTGEYLRVKVQRYGKEARQGVGYLEDGTMVVVNGGGQYLGETIDVRVLSVKHTASGRMIFCNADDGEGGNSFSSYDEDEGEEPEDDRH